MKMNHFPAFQVKFLATGIASSLCFLPVFCLAASFRAMRRPCRKSRQAIESEPMKITKPASGAIGDRAADRCNNALLILIIDPVIMEGVPDSSPEMSGLHNKRSQASINIWSFPTANCYPKTG